MKQQILFLVLVALLLVPTSLARTKEEAIQAYFDSLDTGFGYSEVAGDIASISATKTVIELSGFIQYSKLDKDKLFHFFQSYQNNDSGFGEYEGDASSFNASIEGALGLHELGYNVSMVSRWEIMQYLNQSIFDLLMESRVVGNTTMMAYRESYSALDFVQVSKFLSVANSYNYKWTGNVTYLILKALEMQYKNGSFASIIDAWASIQFLTMVGYGVADSLGAREYLLAHQSTEGGFSPIVNRTGSLKTTWRVLTSLFLLGYNLKNLPYFEETVKFILDLQDPSGGFHEKNGKIPTLTSTRYALYCLFYLGRLNELQQKEFLQAEGFISWGSSILLFGGGLIMVVLLKRESKSRELEV